MTNARWMINLLILSVFLSGCGMVENTQIAHTPIPAETEPLDAEPTRTPIPVETESPDAEPTHTPISVETESPNVEPTHAAISVEEEPPSLYMLHGDIAFPMDRGSYCWSTTDEGGVCVDVAAFPLFYGEDKYTLVIGNTLELLFDAPFPDTITASLYPDPEANQTTNAADIMVEATMDENGRVLVTILDDVTGNYALIISATWAEEELPYGDALYATPVRFEQ